MSSNVSPRLQAQNLLDFCVDDGNTGFVDEIISQARAAMLAGGGVMGAITSVTENSKTVTRDVDMGASAALFAARTAKKYYAAGYREIPTRTVGIFA